MSLRSRLLSVFDLDGTLLVGNASFHFGRYLYQRGELRFLPTLRMVLVYGCHRYLGLCPSIVHESAHRLLFEGRDATQLQSLVDHFLKQELSGLIYPPALHQLRMDQAAGHEVAVLSNGPDFLVGPLAQQLGVKRWKASRYPLDAEGRFAQAPRIFSGEEKASYLRVLADELGVDMTSTVAYSDSKLDIPLLEAAGHAVGVNPDAALRRLCARKGWSIL